MGKIYHNITELIGHTPLLELHALEQAEKVEAKIFGKLEFFNPSGSVKDRIAYSMILAKEEAGDLKPGGTIIEGTSGNTGIGIAAIGAAKGYKVKITMPDNLFEERTRLLKAFGAEVYHTPGELNMGGANAKAAQLLAETENAVIL
ncbi:MAG: pyridoxal-phosphate dependent enzyme, partial [Lachnospiraceae bacterium]|nr:pyridoxal-phosphate dependent enzyme [Lachnospiraceae bacterium]